MIWIIVTSSLSAIISAFLGFRKLVHLHNLKRNHLLIFVLSFAAVFTVLRILHLADIFTEDIAGASMAGFYASVAGFLFGAAIANYKKKRSFGKILYRNRNFVTDILPMLFFISLLLMGIFRTSLFGDLPVTPIRLTSGMSVFMLGLWGFTLQPVPEFRNYGIIIIDRFIPWKDFLSYRWYDEESIEIEYRLKEEIILFVTRIPPDDQIDLERILNEKMIEKHELTSNSS